MFESLIGLLVIVALLVMVVRQQKRLNLVERELGALRNMVLAGVALPKAVPSAENQVVRQAEAVAPLDEPATEARDAGEDLPAAAGAREGAATVSGPWAASASTSTTDETQSDEPQPAQPARPAARPDIETALGTRWAVWVGGIALALGGLFLVRYTIEAGIFGPGVRLTLAGLFGLLLAAVGEFIRRTGFKVPVQGVAGAYIPAILTAAGAFVLFGTVYAAHGVYGFIGPTAAFALMGLIGIATLAAALVHGQALAGIGLLGSLVTPILVSSQSPNAWALFGYIAIVLAATGAVARIRSWNFLMAAAFVGSGLWMLAYLMQAPQPDFTVIVFIAAVTLVVLAFVWLGRHDFGSEPVDAFDVPSVAVALFIALSPLALFIYPPFAATGGVFSGAVLILAMLGVAFYRSMAMPLLYGAGIAATLAFLHILPVVSVSLGLSGGYLEMGGVATVGSDPAMKYTGWVLGLVFVAAGFWTARRDISRPLASVSWAGWGVAVPLVALATLWIAFGNIDQDFFHAAIALLLVAGFSAGAEWIARSEQPLLSGGLAVSAVLAGAGLAGLLFIHMAFGSGLTTVFAGLLAVVPALATRWRSYPVLGWLSVGSLIATICRVAFDPTIVGAAFLSTMPVFNWLLLGYGIPALAFGYCAWQLARTTDGRPRLAMEAGAALFALLTVAMLVRHAMHGGVIDDGALTLAEQAIYTLIALGAGGILIAIDMRSPSSVMRYGSLAVGVMSVASIVIQHFFWLNPLFTDEATGGIPIFNLLFLAYLLPAVAAGGLAFYARGKRPKWYSAMLALVAALLAFSYATLSVRRIFKGEFIGLWSGMEPLETYSYSALWLVLGVALLTLGVWLGSQVLRIASAALISIAVLKVFLFDMSELEGVLRALSFIGLGVVLIGIGLFYQRLLTRSARERPQPG